MVSGQAAMNYRQELAAGTGRDIAAAFVRLLADIHSIDLLRIESFKTTAARSMPEQVISMLDAYGGQWSRHCESQSAIVSAAFAWMRRNLPRSQSAGHIVHGDPTFRNLMLEGGKITALLDWETWHIGDPVEDLAYCRDEIERYLPAQEWQALYTARAGYPIDEDRLRYWSLWKWLRGTVTSVTMKDKADSDPRCDLRTAFGGIHFTRLCLRQLAEALERL
jgi:aminoglycoside phosphotransferase (APT) family kinase protein